MINQNIVTTYTEVIDVVEEYAIHRVPNVGIAHKWYIFFLRNENMTDINIANENIRVQVNTHYMLLRNHTLEELTLMNNRYNPFVIDIGSIMMQTSSMLVQLRFLNLPEYVTHIKVIGEYSLLPVALDA